MYSKRLAVVFMSIVLVVALGVLFSSCSSGGGGAAGPAVDNMRANGVYKIVFITGGYGGGGEIGTMTFNGAGSASYLASSPVPTTVPQVMAYTVTTDNAITIDSDLIGNMRSGGSFFVATSVTPSNLGTIIGIKQSTLVSEPSNTYTYMSAFHQFRTTTTMGAWTGMFSAVTASPSSGQLTLNTIVGPGPSGTTTFSLASNGTFSVPSTAGNDLFGAISSDKEMWIMGDVVPPDYMAIVGLRLPGTGMTAASVNGTYIMHESRESFSLPNNNNWGAARGRLVMSGTGSTGTATYTELATSGTPDPTPFTFGYTMASDGTFTIEMPGYMGVALKDGTMFTLVDYGSSTMDRAVMIGVKQ